MTSATSTRLPGQRGDSTPRLARPGRRRRVRRPNWPLFAFAFPALALYLVFFIFPTLQAFQFATSNWDGTSDTYDVVGAKNFVNLLTNDDRFVSALTNNLKFLLVVVAFQSVFALLFAMFLVKNTRTSILLRALYFFPTVLSSVAVGFIWSFVYNSPDGLLNQTLRVIGLGGLQQAWLGSPQWTIVFVGFAQVWAHTGQMLVVFVAGLQQIPRELYEAAETDGASRWARFRYVTWPMVAPATAIVVAYTTVQSFKAFDIIGALTSFDDFKTQILTTQIYLTAFQNARFGYAAAESILLVLLIVVITWTQRRLVRASRVEE
ncbi:carbohydrate ABC transporter permease [Micromonospora sp. MS34]|uniref:carbohydrate ABC transporter permease n=1 Tax=Micromonospora sp. MS34 TaxID=3385971 RepID=UPI0039A11EC5